MGRGQSDYQQKFDISLLGTGDFVPCHAVSAATFFLKAGVPWSCACSGFLNLLSLVHVGRWRAEMSILKPPSTFQALVFSTPNLCHFWSQSVPFLWAQLGVARTKSKLCVFSGVCSQGSRVGYCISSVALGSVQGPFGVERSCLRPSLSLGR